MKGGIREKLQIELNKKIQGEPQVIYILSRVRKVLEIDKVQKEYRKLKFYCNWSLHAEINNVGAVKDLLDGILNEKSTAGNLTMRFLTLHEELKKFLQAYDLSTVIYDSDENTFLFNKFLSQIYSDTPLVVNKKVKIIWKGQAGENSFGGSFKIEPVGMNSDYQKVTR